MRQHDRITRQNGLDTGFERHAEQGTGDTTTSEKNWIRPIKYNWTGSDERKKEKKGNGEIGRGQLRRD